MLARLIVRFLAAVSVVAFAFVAFSGASGSPTGPQASVAAPTNVGVPTGTYVDGVEVHRLPSITVTARREDAR